MNWQPVNTKLWTLMHDGVLTAIHGSIPGDLTFTIEAEWFPGAPGRVLIHLHNCTFLEMENLWTGHVLRDCSELATMEIEILSGKINESVVEVFASATQGADSLLRLCYDAHSIAQGDGSELSYEHLAAYIDQRFEEWLKSQRP